MKPLGEYVDFGSWARVFGTQESSDTDALQIELCKAYMREHHVSTGKLRRFKRRRRKSYMKLKEAATGVRRKIGILNIYDKADLIWICEKTVRKNREVFNRLR